MFEDDHLEATVMLENGTRTSRYQKETPNLGQSKKIHSRLNNIRQIHHLQ